MKIVKVGRYSPEKPCNAYLCAMTYNMKRSVTAVCAILMIMLITSCSTSRRTIAIEDGWDLLGELNVDYIKDKDRLDVRTTNRYTAVRFKIENKETIIKDLKIVFQNGDKLEPNLDETIAAGQYSRIIELSTEGKNISHIEFKYRSTGSILKGRASVLVFGKRSLY